MSNLPQKYEALLLQLLYSDRHGEVTGAVCQTTRDHRHVSWASLFKPQQQLIKHIPV